MFFWGPEAPEGYGVLGAARTNPLWRTARDAKIV